MADRIEIGQELRIKRDFKQMKALVKAHALLHQTNRSFEGGAVIAEWADYDAVFRLLEPIAASNLQNPMSRGMTEIVEAVRELLATHPDGVPQNAIAARLRLTPSSVSRRVGQALSLGYVRNAQERSGASRLFLNPEVLNRSRVFPHPDDIRMALESSTSRVA